MLYMGYNKPIDKKDNYFKVPLEEGNKVHIHVEGEPVIEFIVPYDSELKCYLAREAKPIFYKD